MKNHTDKFLLGFLGFGILLYLLSMGYDPSSDFSGNSSNADTDTSILDTSTVLPLADTMAVLISPESYTPNEETASDTSIVSPLADTMAVLDYEEDSSSDFSRNPSDDTSSVRPLADTMAVLQRKISLESYTLNEETATHWKLPTYLEEISGLAMTRDDRLLAHNDERGVIFEIDYQKGSIVKSFQLSDMKNPVASDFEGIATIDDQIYLVTSSGRLYACREGTAGESVLFNVYTTGVGRDCEIESLAYDESQRALLLMCKDARSADMEGKLAVYHWSIDEKQLKKDAHIAISVDEFSQHIKGKKFQPSGIERHPMSGNYFIVAARQGAIAEITPGGQVVAVREFPAQWHRQVEGITFAADGTLIVSDEGAGKRARLTLYPVSDSQ
ncbi:MAG: hypothetical protein F4Y39_18820 [Gemmatimonadetes bacterium]|nr:hypothetical protein [Gemmatimonadota bacterium]MYK52029.1 hypothetical protein [Gemmatimonadota bacterium]